MPELILPDARVQTSFLTAMKEFQAEGRGGADDNHSMLGREIQLWGDRWEDPAAAAAQVEGVAHQLRRRITGSQVAQGQPHPAGLILTRHRLRHDHPPSVPQA